MAVATVLTDQSPGAPALNGQDGSGYGVIKWAAQELGMTIAFDDPTNSRIVIRTNPDKGPGRYYRFRDRAADHGLNSGSMAVQSFASMSDVDTGTDGYPSVDHWWYKSQTTDATARSYRIIGTDAHLWFLPSANSSSAGNSVFYLGVYKPYDPANANNEILLANPSTTTTPTASRSGLVSIAYVTFSSVENNSRTLLSQALARSIDGLTTGANAHPTTASPNINASLGIPGSIGIFPNPVGAGVPTSRIEVAEGSGGARVGQLVGALAPMADVRTAFSDGQVIAVSNGAEVVDALFVRMNVSISSAAAAQQGAVLFDITSDWDDW